MSAAICWTTRWEADPDCMPPECSHDGCDSMWAECRFDYLHASCTLEEGHDGPHGEWVNEADITFTFVEAVS